MAETVEYDDDESNKTLRSILISIFLFFLEQNGTRPKLASDVNLTEIAKKPECDGYSGADLAALVREAGIQSVKDLMNFDSEVDSKADLTVSLKHFERALKKIRPSVSPEVSF